MSSAETPRTAELDEDTGTRRASNTAGITVGLDWLAFTLTTTTPAEVQHILATLAPGAWTATSSGWRGGYRRRLAGPEGATVAFDPAGGHRNPEEVLVELPGGWCTAAGPSHVRDLLAQLAAWRGRATRVDLAGDDLARNVEVVTVVAAIDAGQLRARARPNMEIRNLDGPGRTVVIGSQSSDQQLVIYDKEAESGGAIKSVRWELRLRHRAAELAFQQLLHRDVGDLWRERLVSFVDFIEDGVRTPWFAALVGSATRVCQLAPRPDPTLAGRLSNAEHLTPMFRAIEEERPGFLADYLRSLLSPPPALS